MPRGCRPGRASRSFCRSPATPSILPGLQNRSRGLTARHVQALQAGLPPPPLPAKLGFGERPHRHVLDDMTRFQATCRELGVGPGDLVSLADLQQGRACHRVASCLWDLASILRRAGLIEVRGAVARRCPGVQGGPLGGVSATEILAAWSASALPCRTPRTLPLSSAQPTPHVRCPSLRARRTDEPSGPACAGSQKRGRCADRRRRGPC